MTMTQAFTTLASAAAEAANDTTAGTAAPTDAASGGESSSFWIDLVERPGVVYNDVLSAALIALGIVLVLHLLVVLATRGKAKLAGGRRPRWSMWERLVYLAVMGSVVLLGATAFYSVLTVGAMHRWALFLHLMGAGGFVVVLALVAMTWCMPSLFTPSRASRDKSQGDDDATPSPAKFSTLTKCSFWIMLIAGVVTAGTMLLSMLPLFDTHAMHQMLDAHRYSGLLLFVAAMVHLYSVILGRMGLK